jgi:hypothetical protein
MRDTVQHVCPFEKEARGAVLTSAITGLGPGELAQPGTMISPMRNTTVYLAHSLARAAGGMCETRSVSPGHN